MKFKKLSGSKNGGINRRRKGPVGTPDSNGHWKHRLPGPERAGRHSPDYDAEFESGGAVEEIEFWKIVRFKRGHYWRSCLIGLFDTSERKRAVSTFLHLFSPHFSFNIDINIIIKIIININNLSNSFSFIKLPLFNVCF